MPLIRTTSAREDAAAAVATVVKEKLRVDIENPDEEIRRSAIRLAARAGEAEMLGRRLEHESDAGLRESILTGLARIGGVKAARPLVGLLQNGDAPLRSAIIDTLQSMGDEILPEIEPLLDDENPDLRIYAVNIIQLMRSPRAPDLALRVIATDCHVNVCAAAVDMLAEVGRPEMTDALRAVADRFPRNPFLSFAVRAAIKRIG